jgi:hypothetical protein
MLHGLLGIHFHSLLKAKARFELTQQIVFNDLPGQSAPRVPAVGRRSPHSTTAYRYILASSSAFLAWNSSSVRTPASRKSPSFLIWSAISGAAC